MDENMALTPHETREILFYKTDNGDVKVEILLYQENLWLTQAKMAELFEVQKAAISKHLKNIFTSGELMEDSVVSVLETTAADGKNYPTRYYNLDAIIAVGYRVNSKKATMFRIWANRILKEYIIKGYVMDDERLKEPQNFFGKDYFEEQLERIRDIRASERRFYQKITDIYSQCSADYDVDSPVTKEFFATVQNKLHYAITKHTAAEIIYDRADSTKPNMGLTTWKNAPSGRIRKSDVVIAKNYLDETEMGSLNEIVTMYLDYAERIARRAWSKDATQKELDFMWYLWCGRKSPLSGRNIKTFERTYVLDENSDLYLKLNKELVSSNAVTDKYDVMQLKDMIREHVEATDSERGKEILANFSEYLPKFKKIIPHDYQAMLQAIAQMEEKGLSSEQAQIEAFNALTK